MPENVMSIKQVAEFFQVTERTVYRFVEEGHLRNGFKAGKSWRWNVSDVQSCVDSLRKSTTKRTVTRHSGLAKSDGRNPLDSNS